MRKELLELREIMKERLVNVYLVPTGDFHGSEYLHDFFKTRKYVSGFTGSAGTLVVTADEARLWTDGRYFLQAAMQLDGTGIELMKEKEPDVPTIKEYLTEKLKEFDSPVIGFDGRTVSCTNGREYEELANEYGGHIQCDIDLVGEIWNERPKLNGNPVWQLPLSSAGLPYSAKIKEIRNLMESAQADYNLITTLEDNAWLYNLRGSDVACTPVFFSYTLITPDETILYLFRDSCPDSIIPEGVTVKDYFSLADDLTKLTGGKILIAPDSASYSLVSAIPDSVELIEADHLPSTRLKACKNPIEIASTKEAHINDGVAMVNFIHWIKGAISEAPDNGDRTFLTGQSTSDPLTEIGASDYLEAERRKLPGFLDLSFDTISGYMEHGAIIHYKAEEETNAKLYPEGFLLVDSGGQYETGTTDITRTIALGPLTDRMKECYTTVLKGHLDLAMARFPDGTNGIELDKITKAPLEAYGISYNHGTGHGVGHVLSVHENPNRINTISEVPIIPGMITSNEPGYYPEGEFGIRIENEILCVPDDSGASDYRFENITCCPYEREAIIKDMLTPEETEFINAYHAWVLSSLEPRVDSNVATWLKEVCAPL